MSHGGMSPNMAAAYGTSGSLDQLRNLSMKEAEGMRLQYQQLFPPAVSAEDFIKEKEPAIEVGSLVVNRHKQYLPNIYKVSWLFGDKMRLEGQPFDHVFVKDGFRIAEPKEIEAGQRLYC